MSQRRLDDALAEAALLEPAEPMRVWLFALIHHRAGRSTEANEALHQLIEKHASTSAYRIAQVYSARGETDRAFEWLDRAYAQHDAGLSHVRIVPLLRTLHGDSRWASFMRKMGLAD
jgi:hypothetical protein